MKTSSVLTFSLLSALAAAAPVLQRDLATKTEIVTETVIVYTTVWDDYVPSATAAPTKATSAPGGQFFEKPKPSSTLVAEVKPTTTKETAEAPPAYTPPPAEKPSTPAPAPKPTTTVAPPPPPAPVPEKSSTTNAAPPALTTSLQQAAPVAPSSAPAPAPSSPSSGGGSGGGSFTGEMTIYDAQGNTGACGKPIQDTDMVVALGKPTWGESTYDVMTGESSNPWCGKQITINYEGKSVSATILDLCPECKAGDIDLTPSLWQKVTGQDPKLGGRYKVSWTAA